MRSVYQLTQIIFFQIVKQLQAHSISGHFQLAYREVHSTETALTYVFDDILCALDGRDSVFVILLMDAHK